MSFATDNRGRVPFALVGVLLLVSASVYATGVTERAQPVIERPAAETMDSVSRDTRPALRTAVQDAARDAARNPVTDPADTAAGRALNSSDPFVDALRLRIAVAAREQLSTLVRQRNGVRTTVSLPATDGSTESLRRAKRGIDLSPTDNGASMTVTVQNVTVRAFEGDHLVAQRHRNVSLTVSTPVLALHQRTRRYEERLNRGVLEGKGLSRGLTMRLTAVTMARGYGRYAGAPIQNVLGNRHVELSTNAALLAQQRETFGRHDPAGNRALGIATARVSVLDILGGRHGKAADWTNRLLKPNAVEDSAPETPAEFYPEQPDSPPITTGPDAAADKAYLEAIDELSTTTRGSYRVRSRLSATVYTRASSVKPTPRLSNWTLLSEQTSTETVVTPADTPPTAHNRTAMIETYRTVTVRHTAKRRWYRNGSFRTTTVQWGETARVAVTITTAYTPNDGAPNRTTIPVFERGGALDGPNLAGAGERATTKLLDANSGVDPVAKRAADGSAPVQQETTITAAQPERLDQWITKDLRALRKSVANVSVSVPRGSLAAGDANAAAKLAGAIRERRTALIAAPDSYDGAADRARVAARITYLNRVLRALEKRAAATTKRNRNYQSELTERSTQALSRVTELGRKELSDASASIESGFVHSTKSGDELVVTPDGSPAYLTLAAVDHNRVPQIPAGKSAHPLTARTTNWVAMPSGDAADSIIETLSSGGTRRVSLETAAGTLIAANRTADTPSSANETQAAALISNRKELTAAVRRSVHDAERAVCATATEVPSSTCRAAVVDSRSHWPTLGHRAMAIANGSYGLVFADSLSERGVDTITADTAGVRARVRLRKLRTERKTAVPAETTNQTASAVKQVAREITRNKLKSAISNKSNQAITRLTGASRLPAGVPVAPPPYPWIATVNAWSVTVRGEYQRFSVRARGNAPDGGDTMVRYVRDGSTVRLDADGDGERERLGTNERVSFEASTTIVAAVPAGMPGIGDVDGNRDERSSGWPCPGIDDNKNRCEGADEPE